MKGFGIAFFRKLEETGKLASVKKKTSKGLEKIQELLVDNKREVLCLVLKITYFIVKKCH